MNALFIKLNRRALPLAMLNAALMTTIWLGVSSRAYGDSGVARNQVEMKAVEGAKRVALFYSDELVILMLAGKMDERTALRRKILRQPHVVGARVVRGQPIKKQFGSGYIEEQPIDELDRRALAGEEIVDFTYSGAHFTVTVIVPLVATTSSHGTNCLQCHDVQSGDTTAAIRIEYSQVDTTTARPTIRTPTELEAIESAKTIARLYSEKLLELMKTKQMDQRTIIRHVMLRKENVIGARMIRGQSVANQYGRGYAEEQPVDELDRRALEGEEIVDISYVTKEPVLTVVLPWTAFSENGKSNCLQCHEVKSSDTLGAIRIEYRFKKTK